jgi:hypothetical protein
MEEAKTRPAFRWPTGFSVVEVDGDAACSQRLSDRQVSQIEADREVALPNW